MEGNLYRAGINLGGHFLRLGYLLGVESVQGGNQLGRALSETRIMVGGESVQGGKQLGTALSETTCRLPFGGEGIFTGWEST